MKNLGVSILLLCAGCASADSDPKEAVDTMLKSGEVTHLVFTADGKKLGVANEFRFSFDFKREKCHGRLRSFSTSDWKLTGDTDELNVSDLKCASFANGDWIVIARKLDRFGRGNPFTQGVAFYEWDLAKIAGKEIDVIQQGRDNIHFVPHAIANSSEKRLGAVWVECYPHGLPPVRLVFVLDLNAGKKTVALEDIASGPAPSGLIFSTKIIEFSPEGKYIVSSQPGQPFQIQLHATDTGKLVRSMKLESHATAVSFSPNGKMLAVNCFDGTVLILKTDLTEKINTFKVQGHDNAQRILQAVTFAGDEHLAVVANYSRIELFDTKEWKSIRTFEGGKDRVNCVTATPDGKLLAAGFGVTASSPGRVRVFDVKTGKLVVELE